MKQANQKLKILYLAKILTEETDENHPLTATELIEKLAHYGISAERKSIYGDIDGLNEFGLDIQRRGGAEGGYYVASRLFELPEVKILVDSVQASRFLTTKKSRQLMDKLRSLCSRHEAVGLEHQLFIPGRHKSANETIFYTIDRLHTAIAEDKQVTFEYLKYTVGAKKAYLRNDPYTVSPYALIWNDENYYLVAYDSKDESTKHFRVDKMEQLREVNLPRDGREAMRELNLEEYSSSMFGMYGGNPEKVHLIFRDDVVGAIVDQFGDKYLITPYPERPKWNQIHPEVMLSPQFYGWLFGMTGKVRLVGPEPAVKSLASYAQMVGDALTERPEDKSVYLGTDEAGRPRTHTEFEPRNPA